MSSLTPKQLKELSEKNKHRLEELRAAERERQRKELEWARQQNLAAARKRRSQKLVYSRLIKQACQAAFGGKYFVLTKPLDYELAEQLREFGLRYAYTEEVLHTQLKIIKSREKQVLGEYQPKLLNLLNALWLKVASCAEVYYPEKLNSSFIERELMEPIEKYFSTLVMEEKFSELDSAIRIFASDNNMEEQQKAFISGMRRASGPQKDFLKWSLTEIQKTKFTNEVRAILRELTRFTEDQQACTDKLSIHFDLLYNEYIAANDETAAEQISEDKLCVLLWDSEQDEPPNIGTSTSSTSAMGSERGIAINLLRWIISDAGQLFVVRFNAFCEAAAADGKSVALVPLSGQIDDQSFPTTAHVVVLAEALGFKAKLLSESLRVSWE